MSALSILQRKFPPMVAKLIMWLYDNGYECTFGETQRSQAQADANAAAGSGISNSLHCIRLAIDINLFKDGKYLTDSADYEPLGAYWESIGGSWGGRFKPRPDGNHFSLAYNGVR